MPIASAVRGLQRPRDLAPPSVPVKVIQATHGGFGIDLRSLWQYRELLGFLIWRDVKVRYKQTLIGAAWVVLQPALTMAIFTVVFARLVRIPSDGVPYPLFAFAGLLPWMYVAQAVAWSGPSLVRNSKLVAKVYFPRLIIPLASAATPLVDLALCFAALLGLMSWYGVAPTWRLSVLPMFLLVAVAVALAVSVALAALNVQYRDVGYAIPFLVQFWLYASPVAYPASLVPEPWRALYGLNPMAGVIQGFRWAVVGGPFPEIAVLGPGLAMTVIWLVAGLTYFRRVERGFADVI